MIWEQTINLTRPLRSVQLEIDGDSLDATPLPQTVNMNDEVSCVNAPADLGSRPAAEDTQRTTNQVLEQLVALLQQRRAAEKQTVQELQTAAIEIATAVAEKLFLTRAREGELELERLVSEALTELQVSGPVVVRLNPDDVIRLQTAELVIPASDMTLVGDDSIERGHCQVDGDAFGVRFDWAAQIKELRQRMLRNLMDADAEY